MSFSAIWHRRLKYMLTPQWDLYQRIRERFCGGDPPNWPVLDYGCGIGFGAIQLITGQEDSPVYGIDKDESAVNFAKEALGNLVEFEIADAIGGGWKLEKWYGLSTMMFGLITLIEVVEHMDKESQNQLLEKLAKSLNEEVGVLILSTPNKRSQFRKHDGHIGIHDPASLRALLSPHFSSVTFEDYLGEPLGDDTTISPLVAVCRSPK